jgi:hypothetical protein
MTTAEQSYEYVPSETVQLIGRIATHAWHDRRGTKRVVRAARVGQKLSTLIGELNASIYELNDAWFSNPTADMSSYWNIRSLGWFMRGKGHELPGLYRPSSDGLSETRDLIRSLRDMSPLMERAEQELPEPTLTFAANGSLSAKNALVGGTIQVTGRYLTRRLREDSERLIPVWRGGMDVVETDLPTVIMDALLEVPLATGRPTSFGYFRAANEMEWYADGGPFSPNVVAAAASLRDR